MRMETGIQKTFKRRYDGLFQEYIIFLIYYIDEAGNRTARHDRTVLGGIYKEANPGENSLYGEAIFFDVEEEREIRLLLVKSA